MTSFVYIVQINSHKHTHKNQNILRKKKLLRKKANQDSKELRKWALGLSVGIRDGKKKGHKVTTFKKCFSSVNELNIHGI